MLLNQLELRRFSTYVSHLISSHVWMLHQDQLFLLGYVLSRLDRCSMLSRNLCHIFLLLFTHVFTRLRKSRVVVPEVLGK